MSVHSIHILLLNMALIRGEKSRKFQWIRTLRRGNQRYLHIITVIWQFKDVENKRVEYNNNLYLKIFGKEPLS